MTGEYRLRQRAFREREIERATGDEIIERGCRSFTMEGVARRLGISKATLYQHFSRREDLARAVVSRRCNAAFDDAVRATGSIAPDADSADGPIRLAAYLLRRCLGITVGEDGSGPPCCLREALCPFADHRDIERAFRDLGLQRAVDVKFTRSLMAVSAAAMQSLREANRSPSEADVKVLLATMFPNEREPGAE